MKELSLLIANSGIMWLRFLDGSIQGNSNEHLDATSTGGILGVRVIVVVIVR